MVLIRKAYTFYINITKNTLDTKQKTTEAISGRVKKIILDVPVGWAFNAGVRFKFGRSGEYPNISGSDTEKYLSGDDIDIPLQPNLLLREDKIDIYSINNDTVNDHDIFVTIEVEEEDGLPE